MAFAGAVAAAYWAAALLGLRLGSLIGDLASALGAVLLASPPQRLHLPEAPAVLRPRPRHREPSEPHGAPTS